MPRLMYDSVNPFAIPKDAQMVLVYVDGIYAWSQAGRDRFRHAKQVTCSAVGAVSAQVGDVEVGCIWPPANAVPWVQRARRDGYDPTIYVNERNDWGPVREAFRRAGVPEPHWLVANYNGVREIPAGSIGRQYAHPSDPPGNPTGKWHTAGHWDESWVADYWPGVDDEPSSGGGGAEEGEDDDMSKLRRGDQQGDIYIVTGYPDGSAEKVYVGDPNLVSVLELAHGPVKTVEQWKLDYIPRKAEDADGVPGIDLSALIAGLVPPLVAAVREADQNGLNEEETIEAVREAFRRGSGQG